MILRFLFFLLSLSFCLSAKGQVTYLDSLVESQKHAVGVEKLLILKQIVKCYKKEFNHSEAERYVKESLTIVEDLHSEQGIAYCLRELGRIDQDQKKSKEAFRNFHRSLKIYENRGDTINMAICYHYIGLTYVDIANYDKALFYFNWALSFYLLKNDQDHISKVVPAISLVYFMRGDHINAVKYNLKALKMFDQLNNIAGIAMTINNIGGSYLALRNYEKAIFWIQKSIQLAKRINDSESIMKYLSNLGAAYLEYKDYKKANACFKESLTLSIKNSYQRGIAMAYSGMGAYAYDMNQFDSALVYLNRANKILIDTDNNHTRPTTILLLGLTHLKRKEYSPALKYLEECIYYGKMMGLNDNLVDCYEAMAGLYDSIGQPSKAYVYHKLYSELKDSIYSIETAHKIDNQASEYEIGKKEAEITLLEQEKLATNALYQKQRIKVWAWIIATICSILTGILFYLCQLWRLRVKAVRKEVKEKEKQAKQVVNSIEAERKKISKDLHDSVGVLISASKHSVENLKFKNKDIEINEGLTQISKLLEKSVNEVRIISHQMSSNILSYFGLVPSIQDLLDQTLSANDIKFDFVHDDLVERPDMEVELCIYRVAQEALSNIIKHSKATKVNIELVRKGDILYLSIADNGKGYEVNNKYQGLGLESMRTRVEVLKGSFAIESGTTGTSISVKIPLENVTKGKNEWKK